MGLLRFIQACLHEDIEACPDFTALGMKHYTCDTWCCERKVQLLVRSPLNKHVTWLILSFSPQCLTPRVSAGRSSIYDPSKNICPTTRRNIQWLLLCFSTAAARPSASHPRCRGRTVLHVAAENGQAAVVEQLISAGATVDAATERGRGPGRVFGSFCEWLWRGDGRGSYIGSWFSFFALGCWVVLVLVV